MADRDLILPAPAQKKKSQGIPGSIPGTSCPVRAGTWHVAIPNQQGALAGQLNMNVQLGPTPQPCMENCAWLLPSRDGKKKECTEVISARALRTIARRIQTIDDLATGGGGS